MRASTLWVLISVIGVAVKNLEEWAVAGCGSLPSPALKQQDQLAAGSVARNAQDFNSIGNATSQGIRQWFASPTPSPDYKRQKGEEGREATQQPTRAMVQHLRE